LGGYLKDDAAGRAFLANTPARNGVPLHLLNINTRRAEGEPPTREALAAELAKQGFDQMPKVYAAFKGRDPAFQLTETDLNGWGYNLLSRGDNKAAIAVLKQATVLYPTSGNAFDSLAEAYEINKDKALSIENYRTSLVLDPSNTNAVAHLKDLGGYP
jgi:tetratricopeptide (TPR) repeat protein